MEGVGETLVGVLVLLFLILTVTTEFPKVPLGPFTLVTVVLEALVLGALGVGSRRRSGAPSGSGRRRGTAKCGGCPPPRARAPRWSLGQKVAMYGLRGYLVLGLKIGQLATGTDRRPQASAAPGGSGGGAGSGRRWSPVRLRPARRHHTYPTWSRSGGTRQTVGR